MRRLNTFRHVLQEGSVYELHVFDVARSNPGFKLGDVHVSIRFTEHTVFVDLTETNQPIPRKSFGSAISTGFSYLPVANMNSELPGTCNCCLGCDGYRWRSQGN